MAIGRKTGGRRPGSKNKITAVHHRAATEGLERCLAAGVLPLDGILGRMRNDPEFRDITPEQFTAAMIALPYTSPRLSASIVAGNMRLRADGITHEERLRLLEMGPPSLMDEVVLAPKKRAVIEAGAEAPAASDAPDAK